MGALRRASRARGRVAAALGLGDRRHGPPTRYLGRDRAVTAQGHAPQPPVGAELDDVILAPGASDAEPEAREVVVPVELLGTVALEPVDGTLGDLDVGGHGVLPDESMGSIPRWESHGNHQESICVHWRTSGRLEKSACVPSQVRAIQR